MDDVAKQIRAFVDRFLPQIQPKDPNQLFIPASLLFDFDGEYRYVLFSMRHLRDCLEGYLALIEPVKAFLQTPNEWGTSGQMQGAVGLYAVGHENASELVLAYFSHTPDDDPDKPLLIAFVRESDAVERLKQFVEFFPPEDRGMDGLERIRSVYETVRQIAEMGG